MKSDKTDVFDDDDADERDDDDDDADDDVDDDADEKDDDEDGKDCEADDNDDGKGDCGNKRPKKENRVNKIRFDRSGATCQVPPGRRPAFPVSVQLRDVF